MVVHSTSVTTPLIVSSTLASGFIVLIYKIMGCFRSGSIVMLHYLSRRTEIAAAVRVAVWGVPIPSLHIFIQVTSK